MITAGDRESLEVRDSRGRYAPGGIGNPRGRPKKPPTAEEILNSALVEAAIRLVDLIDSEDDSVALKAAMAILNWGLGEPEHKSKINVDLSSMDISRIANALNRLGT